MITELSKLHTAEKTPNEAMQSNESSTENAVVEMIRSHGKKRRRKSQSTTNHQDLHPDEWVKYHQENLIEALKYAERLRGTAELLHTARDIILTVLHEKDWECASEWVDRYHAQFLPKDTECTNEEENI